MRESPRNEDGEVRLFVDEVKRKLEEEGHTQVTGNHIEAAKVWIPAQIERPTLDRLSAPHD